MTFRRQCQHLILEPGSTQARGDSVFPVARSQPLVIGQNELRAQLFVGAKVRSDLFQQSQGLAIRNRIAERRSVARGNNALIGNFARTDVLQQVTKYWQFGVNDTNDQLPMLVGMTAAKRDGSLAIDQARDIRGRVRRQYASCLILGHAEFCAFLPWGIPRISPGITHKWWRRRDS